MTLPLLAQETISLPLKNLVDPSAPGEKIEERGKGGVIDRAISNVVQPTITVYLPAKDKANGTGIVICPGGGYQHLAIDKEGHDIARWLNSIGIAAVVLKYRLPGSMRGSSQGDIHEVADRIHVALEDAEAAMRLMRANESKWNLKPGAIGMMGFSAGGHLAAMMGMVAPPDSRPDFLVLGYPAIPASLNVTSAMPRTFLVAADDDTTVNPAYVTPVSNGTQYIWSGSTTDIRALQKSAGTDRIASAWYAQPGFTIDLPFTDQNSHQVAIYAMDWDSSGPRAEIVDVLDTNNNVLDTHTLSSFVSGTYLVWNITGHVRIRVTSVNATSVNTNAVINGIFFR